MCMNAHATGSARPSVGTNLTNTGRKLNGSNRNLSRLRKRPNENRRQPNRKRAKKKRRRRRTNAANLNPRWPLRRQSFRENPKAHMLATSPATSTKAIGHSYSSSAYAERQRTVALMLGVLSSASRNRRREHGPFPVVPFVAPF